jgi:DNA-binding NarL/FixJ family response regulator
MRMLESNRELLMLLTRGLSYDDIGQRLDMSTRTVRRRIDRLRAAIGAVNTVELAAWAGAYGLYRPAARFG